MGNPETATNLVRACGKNVRERLPKILLKCTLSEKGKLYIQRNGKVGGVGDWKLEDEGHYEPGYLSM